jgi:uncharacterized protein YijF (DUF1287 family)
MSPFPGPALSTNGPRASSSWRELGWLTGDVVRNPGMISDETICGVRSFHRIVFGDVSDAYQFFPSPSRISDNPDYRTNLQHGRITDIYYK